VKRHECGTAATANGKTFTFTDRGLRQPSPLLTNQLNKNINKTKQNLREKKLKQKLQKKKRKRNQEQKRKKMEKLINK